MKLAESRRDQMQVVWVALLAVVILSVYAVAVLKPLFGRVGQLGQQIRASSLQLRHVEHAVKLEPQLRQERDQRRAAIDTLRAPLPSEQALPAVIERLSDLANQTGVKIQTIFPQRTLDASLGLEQDRKGPAEKSSAFYKEIPIQLDALAGLHQLGSFLSRVESDAQSVQVKTLRISANSKEIRRHNARIVFNVFFISSSEGGG